MATTMKTIVEDDDESTASESEDFGTPQQFSHEEKKNFVPVQVIKIIQPNKMILKIEDQTVTKGTFGGIEFGHQFYSFQTSTDQVKTKVEFKRKMHVIVHATLTEAERVAVGGQEEEDDEDISQWIDDDNNVVGEILDQFHRGIILQGVSGNSSGFTIFLYDIGIIKNMSMFEISPLENDALLTKQLPPRFILMTIPGIVPRETKLDSIKIPGVKSCDIQAADWTPEALRDVEHWISKQKVILFSELMPISKECLFYGDLYGGSEAEGKVNGKPLSKYLTRKRSVYFEYKYLKQIYAKEYEDSR